MNIRNSFSDGRFSKNLSYWITSNCTYIASDGNDQTGIVSIAKDGYIEQTVSTSKLAKQSIKLIMRSEQIITEKVDIVLMDEYGNLIPLKSATCDTEWTQNTYTIRLEGGSYIFRLTNTNDVAVWVDDLTMWNNITTRLDLAKNCYEKLFELAKDTGFSYQRNSTGTEGHFTDAINHSLTAVGAIDPELEVPDIRYLDADRLQDCQDDIFMQMLEKAKMKYITLTDGSMDGQSESLSQIFTAIQTLTESKNKSQGLVIRNFSWEDEEENTIYRGHDEW